MTGGTEMPYVYICSEPGLWTVGFYKPDGKWEPESDHGSTELAAARVAYLNGGEIERADFAARERWAFDYQQRTGAK